jgi:hypothetical protein
MAFPTSPTDGDRHREANTVFIADGGRWKRLKSADRVAAHDSGVRNLDVKPRDMRTGGARGLIEMDYVFAPQSNESAHLQIETTSGWFNWSSNTAESTGYLTRGADTYGDATWLGSGAGTTGLQLHWDTAWYRLAFDKAAGLNIKMQKYDDTSIYIRWEWTGVATNAHTFFSSASMWIKVAIQDIVTVRVAISNITRYGTVARVM